MTKQRRLIHDIINNSCEHMTAEKIHKIAKNTIPSIALGTVYRNLGLMCDDGDIMRVVIPGEPDRFDRNVVYHNHMICDVCGKVMDLFIDDLDAFLRSRTNAEMKSYNLAVHCICSDCANKNHSENMEAKS